MLIGLPFGSSLKLLTEPFFAFPLWVELRGTHCSQWRAWYLCTCYYCSQLCTWDSGVTCIHIACKRLQCLQKPVICDCRTNIIATHNGRIFKSMNVSFVKANLVRATPSLAFFPSTQLSWQDLCEMMLLLSDSSSQGICDDTRKVLIYTWLLPSRCRCN